MQIDLQKLENLIEEDVTIQSMRQRYDELCKKIRDSNKILKPGDDDSAIEAMKCQKKVLELQIQIEELKIRENLIWDTSYKDVNYLKYHATEEEKLNYINITCNTDYKTMDEVDWYTLSKYQNLPEEFIREFKDYVLWTEISKFQQLSEEFIREFADQLDWYYICRDQKLSEELMSDFREYLHWRTICVYQTLSEDFIDDFQDYIFWDCILHCQNVSFQFLIDHIEFFDFEDYTLYYYISEDVIRQLKDYVNWKYVSKYSSLSEEFIREFQDKLNK